MKRKDFDIVPLGAILEDTPRNGYSPVCPELPTGKWVLSLSALDGNGLDLSAPKPAPVNDPLVDKFMLRRGDFLISRSNTSDKVGRVGVFRGELKNCSYPDLMMRFRPDCDKVDPRFLETYLNSDTAIKFIRQHANGTSGSMKKINRETVESIPVVMPPILEQENIAEVISNWHKAIQKNERLIISKFQFYDFLSKTLLGPTVWRSSKHLRADRLFDTISEKNTPELPLLAVTQDQGVIPRSMLDRRISMSASNPANFKVVRENDFVISLRSFQGGLEHSAYDGLVSPAYTVLRCRPELEPRFYRHYLKSPDFIRRLSVAVIGIRDGKQISFRDFASIKLPLPPRDQQQKIARLLDESEKEIKLLKRQALLLQKQKRGLMQKLLTGQWRPDMARR
ncbi:MAG: restriction endonuclease [Xanthomonadales bacterium]|nr:restriction endonuclease [Xanthomonadales bacterium]|tara:strand:- start:912 stop:2096 length:1185 start_codon:yes stop_codon:yes gene_type:complete